MSLLRSVLDLFKPSPRVEWVMTGRTRYEVLTERFGHLTVRAQHEFMDLLSGKFCWGGADEYAVSWRERVRGYAGGFMGSTNADVRPGYVFITGSRREVKVDE
jgi:hypothetical protein